MRVRLVIARICVFLSIFMALTGTLNAAKKEVDPDQPKLKPTAPKVDGEKAELERYDFVHKTAITNIPDLYCRLLMQLPENPKSNADPVIIDVAIKIVPPPPVSALLFGRNATREEPTEFRMRDLVGGGEEPQIFNPDSPRRANDRSYRSSDPRRELEKQKDYPLVRGKTAILFPFVNSNLEVLFFPKTGHFFVTGYGLMKANLEYRNYTKRDNDSTQKLEEEIMSEDQSGPGCKPGIILPPGYSNKNNDQPIKGKRPSPDNIVQKSPPKKPDGGVRTFE